MLQYLVFLGAAVNIVGSAAYARDTLTGKTKPNKVSWLMWSIAPLIATVASLMAGVGWAVLPVFMAGFVPLVIFVLSFVNPQAYWRLGIFDYLCGLFSALALVFWGITKNPDVAIGFAVASDIIAAFPTFLKSWREPESESAIVFVVGLFSALTSFAAVKYWNFSELAFPISLVVGNSSLMILIERRRILKYFLKGNIKSNI